jgi:predicted nucleic acid-binding protein
MNAVDTNVFVYFFDDEEPAKQAQATELLDRLVQPPSETVLLWQVAGESLSCLRRWESAGKRSDADVDADIRDILAMFPLAFPTKEVIFRALNLHSRYSLSHWDSMLVAACIEAGVDTLYSEDLDDGATYDSVEIVNPFR